MNMEVPECIVHGVTFNEVAHHFYHSYKVLTQAKGKLNESIPS